MKTKTGLQKHSYININDPTDSLKHDCDLHLNICNNQTIYYRITEIKFAYIAK